MLPHAGLADQGKKVLVVDLDLLACIRRKDCPKQPESAASKVTLSGHNCGLDTGQLFA